MKLTENCLKYLEYVSQQTGTPENIIIESALNFVAHISKMPKEDQEIIKSLIEKHCKPDQDLKQN